MFIMLEKIKYATLGLTLASGCATLDEHTMHCYKYGACSTTSPVSSSLFQ